MRRILIFLKCMAGERVSSGVSEAFKGRASMEKRRRMLMGYPHIGNTQRGGRKNIGGNLAH